MIHIKKSGFKPLTWDGNSKSYIEEEFEPFGCLRYNVTHIDNDVTIGDIIRFVAENEVLNVFFTFYSSCPVDEFYEAMQKTVPSRGDIHHAMVYQAVELKDKGKGTAEITAWWNLNGVGPTDEDEPFPDGKKAGEIIDNWSISDLCMEELMVLPIKIVAKSVFIDCRGKDSVEWKHEHDLESTPSLLEFLDAILFDISFSGGPEERAEFAEFIGELSDEVRDGIQDGTLKGVAIDDLKNKIKETIH